MRLAKQILVHKIGGPEVLRVAEVGLLSPAPGQILVKVEAAGVLYGDVMRRTDKYLTSTPLPYSPGTEIAGTVEEVGDDVTTFKIGDRVVSLVGSSGYAQYAVTTAESATLLPASIGYAEATALLAQGITAFLLTHDAADLKGKTVFIESAAGGVGMLMVQMAKALGAAYIVGSASSAAKRAFAMSHGVDLAVDSTTANWSQDVIDATGGRGIDVAYESSGASFAELLICLSSFGTLVKFGRGVKEKLSFDPSLLLSENQSLRGFYLPGYRDPAHLHLIAAATEALIEAVLAGKLRVEVGHRFPLHEAELAHRAIENRQTMGKVVLEPWAAEGRHFP